MPSLAAIAAAGGGAEGCVSEVCFWQYWRVSERRGSALAAAGILFLAVLAQLENIIITIRATKTES